MVISNISNSRKELFGLFNSKTYDPNIELYHVGLKDEAKSINFNILPNQFCYISDLYKKKIVHINNNITKILGYTMDEISFIMLYDIIHPADRLLIYLATIKSINFAHRSLKGKPFENVFTMDYRVKTKDNHYIRVMRETGCAVNDKLGNMVFTFALYTDISNIKTSNKIGFDYRGTLQNLIFPDDELLNSNNFFSKREKEILHLLAKGKLSREIAEILFISKHTVDTHRRNMLHKAMLKNTPELILFAMEKGII